MTVPNVTLSNGVKMPQIGLGVYKTADGQEVVDAVNWSLEAGYRMIDTAMIYGNEKGVGEAISASSLDRKDLFITTKLWNDDHGYESTLKAFDKSLDKLGLDYLDLYLIHWPFSSQGKTSDTWRAFEKLYSDGRVRAIGVSNFHEEHLDELAKTAMVTPMVNQIELHPYLAQESLRDYCKQKGIVVESWSPIMRGGDILGDHVVFKIAASYDKTPAQVILRWHIQLGLVVIPKSVHQDRIRQNIDIFDFTLTDAQVDAICQLDVERRIGPHPDSF